MSRGLPELLAAPPRAAMLPDAILARARELEGMPTPDAAALRALRPAIARCLGLPRIPRAPVAFQAVRELPADGYTVEVGTYEGLPGLPVPAHVYRPDGPGPHPAVVHSPGHWMENARLEPDLQRTNALLARSGVAVLCYDPIGQGERRTGWHGHAQLAPLLAGFTSLGVMVAEALVGLDVLAARPDVDAARLGVVGASGGGLVSTFAAAVEPRIVAAAICCILNTHVSQLADAAYGTGWDGWADLCNQVPRLAATANMGYVVAAAAPCRLTVVHAVDDPPFPLAGARRVVAEATAGYAACGCEEGVRLVEVAGGHGLHPAMRGAAADALVAALGLPELAPERDVALLDRPYAVTHDVASAARPQTLRRDPARLPGEALPAQLDADRPLVELARSLAAEDRAARYAERGGVARALGGLPALAPTWRVTNHVALPEGGYGQRLVLEVCPGIALDALLLLPDGWGDDAPGVVVTVDEGGKGVAVAGPVAAAARAAGWAVLAPDLRGTGESAASELELATAAYLLDRDLLAWRLDDLRACLELLSGRYSTGQQIDKGRLVVHAEGDLAPLALLLAALDARVAGALATGFPATLEELLVPDPPRSPMVFPFGALAAFDLPDLVRLAAPRPAVQCLPGQDAAAAAAGLLAGLPA